MKLALSILLAACMWGQTAVQINPLQVSGYSDIYPNSSSGTTLYNLAKVVNNQATPSTTSDTAIPVYIVIYGAGTTGNAYLAKGGEFPCQMDGSGATAGHFIGNSTATAKRCMDLGATAPSTGWVIGVAITTAGANANAKIDLSQGYNASAGCNLGGDLSGPCSAATVVKVNGGAIPGSQPCIGTNGSNQFINGTCGGGTFPSYTQTSTTVATFGSGQFQLSGGYNVSLSSCTGTFSGTASTDTIYVYWSGGANLNLGYGGTETLTGSTGCNPVSGISTQPPGSYLLYKITISTPNTWPSSATYLGGQVLTVVNPGSGLQGSYSLGVQQLTTDPTQVPRYFIGSGAPSITCTAGRDFYTDTSALNLYFCDAVNTWKLANSGGGGGGGGGVSGTATLGTSSITSGSCATVVSVAASGVTSTTPISWSPNASIKGVTGYAPSSAGGLSIALYPTAGFVNVDVCNWTTGSVTPGAVTLNWQAGGITLASGTAALGTASILSGACANVVSIAAAGTTSTNVVSWTPNASLKAVTGYAPSTSGGLSIMAYPTLGFVNFDVCNWSTNPITPGSAILNWQVN